jgi:hypothetical protein
MARLCARGRRKELETKDNYTRPCKYLIFQIPHDLDTPYSKYLMSNAAKATNPSKH